MPKILNRDFSASCSMEAAVVGETEPEKMVEAIKTFTGGTTAKPTH